MPSPNVAVRRSKVQGRGVFATRAFAKDERILEYLGQIITDDEADAQCDDEGMRRHHTFLFGLEDGYTVDGAQGGNEARFINHSCEPNCESVIEGQRVFIHALRAIAAGDEIFYDYWYTTDEGYTLDDLRRIYPCRCGAPTCRGTLARPPRRRRKAS
jgi:SET domain-containing protein